MKPLAALLAAALLSVAPAASAGSLVQASGTASAVRLGARYERAVNFVGGLEQVAVTAEVPLALHWRPFASVPTAYSLQAAAGAFINGGPRARPFVEVGPAMRFEGGRWFADLGIAPTLIGGSDFRDDRTLGGSFFFTTHVAAGWRQGTWRIGLRFQHTSNANLDVPNPGVNMVGIVVSTRI